ncbi:MAG TPA: hypothetical protein G4O02_11350 [Caldilineae bacterium]|nr:hypothetical protein [Caldilineae bacterium]
MPQSHMMYISDFLLSTRTLVLAGRDLEEALARDNPAAIEFAIMEIEQAYTRYDQASERYHLFMLSRLETTRSTAQAEQVSMDGLASLVTDFQVSYVLAAASQAVGEIAPPTRGDRTRTMITAPPPLAEALGALEETTQALRRPLMESTTPPVSITRGMLRSGEAITVESVQSPSLQEAIQTFQTVTSETLEELVRGVRQAIMACLEALSGLDKEDITEALQLLGRTLEEIPNLGRLLRLAIDRLRKAIANLIAWLGDENVEGLKGKVEETLRRWLNGEQIDDGLRWALAIESTRQLAQVAVTRPGLAADRLDEASTEIKVLRVRFDEHMTLIAQAAKTVTLLGGLLTASLGTQAILLSVVTYLAVIAWAVGMGIDYADSGRILDRVEGVGTIIQRLLQ